MKTKLLLKLLLVLCFQTVFSFSDRNQCMDLYNIHLGYNALTNCTEFNFGYKTDLQYSYILLKHFPKNNTAFQNAATFLTQYTTQENHPPIATLLENTTEENATYLSYLCLESCFKGDIENWKYLDKLESTNKSKFFLTKIWTYPMRWQSHKTMKNSDTFIHEYDELLQKENKLSPSEKYLYELFKIQVAFEASKNKEELLTRLNALILANKSFFSLTNYKKYITNYFPDYKIPTELQETVMDSYDKEWGTNNFIYKEYKSSYNSLKESINAIKTNPFDPNVATYSNVKKWITKENYVTIIQALDELNALEKVHTKTCKIPALSFDLLLNITDMKVIKFTDTQQTEINTRMLKKWLDFHIKCGLTMMFYMDKNLIAIWDNLSKKEQEVLGKYFETELTQSDNLNYWKAMQKTLRQK